MPKCRLWFGHDLKLESGGMISCKRCLRKWNPREGGREVLPIGYTSWAAWQDEWLNRSGVPGFPPQIYLSSDERTKLSEKEIKEVMARR